MVAKLEHLSVEELNVDLSYQRAVSRAKVQTIVEEFDPSGVGVLQVSKRENGKYYVVDGQHRMVALKKLKIGSVACAVYEGMTLNEEIRAFVYYNTSKAPTSMDIFRAKLEAGDPEVVKVNSAIEFEGFEIDVHSKGRGIRCIGTINRITGRERGLEQLQRALELIRDGFGTTTDPMALNYNIVYGLASFVQRYGNLIDYDYFKETLSRVAPADVIAKAQDFRRALGGDLRSKVIYALVHFYNYRKRVGRLEGTNIVGLGDEE